MIVSRVKMKCCIRWESFVLTKIIHESFPRDFFHDPKRKNQQNGRIIFFGMFKAPRKRSYALVNSLHLAASMNFSFSWWFKASTRLKRNILTSINYLSNVENKKMSWGKQFNYFYFSDEFFLIQTLFSVFASKLEKQFRHIVAMFLKWSPRPRSQHLSIERYTALVRQGIM